MVSDLQQLNDSEDSIELHFNQVEDEFSGLKKEVRRQVMDAFYYVEKSNSLLTKFLFRQENRQTNAVFVLLSLHFNQKEMLYMINQMIREYDPED